MTGLSVLFDASPITAGDTGVARSGRRLLTALQSAGVEVQPFAVGRGRYPRPPGTRRRRIPRRALDTVWARVSWPTAEQLAGRTADVLHALDCAPMPSRLPIVVTVHDLAAIEHPELHPNRSIRQQQAQLAALDRVSVIVASSRDTADALVRHGAPADRIEVVQLAAIELPPPQPVAGLAPGFVLAVGTLHRRKGFDVLLRAVRSAPAAQLVIAGPDAGAVRDLAAMAGELGVSHRTRFLGRVSDAQLSWLYAHAGVFVFPSLAEGFGLPVLEAMAAGTPTVCSDLPVLREVAGDAALFFPPGDAQALAAILGASGGRDTLAGREMSQAGRVRAAQFTWAATAAGTVDCYERAAEGSRRPPRSQRWAIGT